MKCSIDVFIKDYAKAIEDGYSAVFAGAGLSRPSGYVNWRELLEPFANEINLDVDKEYDLLAIPQYYFNKYGNRGKVNQAILNEFTKDAKENENINILTRLPISTYWTTNYDNLIERGLEKNNRKPDVKISEESLANNIVNRDAVVYKMHGDILDPSKTVLLKDDYEAYSTDHQLYITALQGDLISKTFMFIGFSFDDPNMNSILARIRLLLGTSIRNHYCLLESVKKDGDDDSYQYKKAKQELIIQDLQRYGIQAVMLDDYSQIPSILLEVEKRCKMRNIFISGSIGEATERWDYDDIMLFSHKLSRKLISENYKVISGFGVGIGSSVINGALEEIKFSRFKHISDYMLLRPFPQFITGETKSLIEEWTEYREDMINQSGVAIFIFGNKKMSDGSIQIANGMLEEFEIAKKQNKCIIPVGVTGGAAEVIFDLIKKEKDSYSYVAPYLKELAEEQNIEKLISIIIRCLKSI